LTAIATCWVPLDHGPKIHCSG